MGNLYGGARVMRCLLIGLPRMGRAAAIVAFALVLGSAPAAAQSDREDSQSERSNFAFGVTAGTLGVGAEVAVKLHPNLVMRASASAWTLDTAIKFDNGDRFPGLLLGQFVEQSTTLTPSVTSAGLMLDVHLFRDGGRMSGGLRYLDYGAEGAITSNDASLVKIGNNVYVKDSNAKVGIAVTNGSPFLPYAGLGYDAAMFKDYGLSLSIDAGVIFGSKPQAVVTATNVRTPFGGQVSPEDLKIEQKKIEDDLKGLQYFPVLMLSAKYRF